LNDDKGFTGLERVEWEREEGILERDVDQSMLRLKHYIMTGEVLPYRDHDAEEHHANLEKKPAESPKPQQTQPEKPLKALKKPKAPKAVKPVDGVTIQLTQPEQEAHKEPTDLEISVLLELYPATKKSLRDIIDKFGVQISHEMGRLVDIMGYIEGAGNNLWALTDNGQGYVDDFLNGVANDEKSWLIQLYQTGKTTTKPDKRENLRYLLVDDYITEKDGVFQLTTWVKDVSKKIGAMNLKPFDRKSKSRNSRLNPQRLQEKT